MTAAREEIRGEGTNRGEPGAELLPHLRLHRLLLASALVLTYIKAHRITERGARFSWAGMMR
jgi:hypothetical protein